MAAFQIKKATNGQYFFTLTATGDDETLLQSETYMAKGGCTNGIASVKLNAPDGERYSLLTAQNGAYYFNVKARNGEVIGTSMMYSTIKLRDTRLEMVKAQAPDALVEDLS